MGGFVSSGGFVPPTRGGSSGSSSGGGILEWSAGTYNAGDVVTRGPYLWRANATTTEDPIVVEGNLGSASDWSLVTSGVAGASQANGIMSLITGFTASAATGYRQSVNSGFLGKMLIVDLQMSGAADWFHFGLYNSADVQTHSNVAQVGSPVPGFYGLNINLFNARVENWIAGVQATNSSYTNANATNGGSGFTRWYMSMLQNGANWDLALYRDTPRSGSVISGLNSTTQVDDLAPIAQFTNVARPAYTDWRFVVGARTGGSAGTFRVRGAWVRNIISGNWTAIARKPTQLG